MNHAESPRISIPEIGRIHTVGNLNLLREPRAAILNSRQGKFPAPSVPWLRKTLEVATELVRKGHVVVSSIGMFTWELVTWKVGTSGGKLILVVSGKRKQDATEIARRVSHDFALDLERTLLLFPENGPQHPEFFKGFPSRDQWIVALADKLYPVAIRPEGNLTRMLELLSSTDKKKVDANFAILYTKAARRICRFPTDTIETNASLLKWEYLSHWTRATASPWPGETMAEFYSSFERNSQEYPRSGFHTLRRILRERRIRASKQLIRGELKVVSLTACPPWELASLVKWRPSLLRWTFEPYGIALSRVRLESLDVRPVIYAEDEQYHQMAERDKPFFQSPGHGKNDWSQEREWRHTGDLELGRFRSEDAIVFTLTEEEATLLRNDSPFPAVCWDDIPKKFGL